MRARRLIIAMPKGGSGKTATAVTLAWGLRERGKRVLLIDLDPQGNASAALGVGGDGRYRTLDLLLRPERPLDATTVADGLDLVAARPWRAGLDLALPKANQLTGPIAVREAIERVEAAYDYVLCDCAPGLGPVTYNALAAGPVLAPVEMTRLAVSVIPELDRVVATLRRGVSPTAIVLGYHPTRHVQNHAESKEALVALRAMEGDRVLRSHVPASTSVARSLAEGTSLFDRRYRRSRAPAAYNAVIEEVTALLEEHHGRSPNVDRWPPVHRIA